MDDVNPYSFLREWFSVPHLSHVSRMDLKMWLAWAVFDRQFEEIVSPAAMSELEAMIADGERELGITVPLTVSGEVVRPPAMRLNVDRVKADHRPLVYYIATGIMGFAGDAFLYFLGFRRERIGPVFFWVRLASASRHSTGEFAIDEDTPLVFVHGVGMGLATYIPLLLKLSGPVRRPVNRTIILIELPHVSMKFNVDVVPRMDAIAECTAIIMNRYNIHTPALWMAHSLGTFVFAAVQRLQPHLVAGVILVDPVCFLLWEPDLLRNFCYLNPETPMQIIQQYHISRELTISSYFHRHFWWHECVQFAKNMPKHSLVFISENDVIYNTERVKRYLEKNGIPLKVMKGMSHGGWLMDRQATAMLADAAHLCNVPKVAGSSKEK